MEKQIGFAIPGLYTNHSINKVLLKLKDEYPNSFYDNIKIEAFFGNFQFCIWDGGRIFSNYSHATIEQVEEIREFYNDKYNIPIRFIYTNNQIQEKDLTDRFCNLVTGMCENGMNEIVINSPLLEKYLRETYPKYKFISSTTKCLKKSTDANDELNKNYFRVCLDYNLNYNLNFLKTLTEEQKEKTEFLVNAICAANCQNRAKHYKLNSIYSLNYGKDYFLDFCNIYGSNLYPFDKQTQSRNQLDIQDILTTYKNLGFYHYKLEGRTFDPLSHFENCIKYLVKPEYQLFMIEMAENYLKKEENQL